MKTKTYDPACAELARHFLEDEASESDVSELAGEIQQAVEDWMDGR